MFLGRWTLENLAFLDRGGFEYRDLYLYEKTPKYPDQLLDYGIQSGEYAERTTTVNYQGMTVGKKTNNITVGTMKNSQVQQDVQHSTQKIEQNSFQADLNDFVETLIRDISKVQDQATAKALLADAETIKTQNNAPNPKKGIIKECLLSIKNIIEGAAGSVLASYIPVMLPLIACL
ncbi:hypothetical protein [Pseudomonas syringae]|uniref:hypothetical protein n=1 Tax=Pseudomonas syringae TaxID=317 RepID=UPI001F3F5E10|nr:hypothetical protein [Pseudomonas syringae]MBL3827705.1 hypothetical protein [Pseudomonas syringae pv. theae]MBL3835078.1 hypothetical protein [Pseudomonas syringae pv. theae]MBL3869537.1 hypothetical protein [Pseudomonas syringae pv. theae]GKQ43543.1 hypothetical protein PSTH2693_00325 [Pseudomonas syringae pv. theae]